MRSKKILVVDVERDGQWAIPAEVIAHNRASYYGDKEGAESYAHEYEYTLNDEGELLDWAANNMNWADVEMFAVRYRPAKPEKPDYQEAWINGEKKVIDCPLHIEIELPKGIPARAEVASHEL